MWDVLFVLVLEFSILVSFSMDWSKNLTKFSDSVCEKFYITKIPKVTVRTFFEH